MRAQAKCRICGEESIHNDAHHIYYPESFWDTTADHLIILCRPCHDLAHALIDARKKSPSESCKEWEHIIKGLREWRVSKSEWLATPVVPTTPPRLRKAYEALRSEFNELKKRTSLRAESPPSDPDKPTPKPVKSECKFCGVPGCKPRNMYSVYGDRVRQELWWVVCDACFVRIDTEAGIPKESFSKGPYHKCIRAWMAASFPR